MRRAVIVLVMALLIAALSGAAFAATKGSKPAARWTAVTEWHYAPNPHSVQVDMRQVGTPMWAHDNTHPLTYTALGGERVTENVSTWSILSLRKYLPAKAKVVLLSIKTIITKAVPGNADVFVFGRQYESSCCHGPTGSLDTPVDFSTSQNPDHLGIIAQAVQGSPGGVRQFSSVIMPLRNRKLEIAWGYQKEPADALGFDIYLDGWAS